MSRAMTLERIRAGSPRNGGRGQNRVRGLNSADSRRLRRQRPRCRRHTRFLAAAVPIQMTFCAAPIVKRRNGTTQTCCGRGDVRIGRWPRRVK